MSVTIGMPSLKLNNVGRVGKHSGSFKKVAEEALAERRGRDRFSLKIPYIYLINPP